MTAQWYCRLGGREVGPLSSQQLLAMSHKGQISPDTPVRQGETGSWVAARSVKGLFSETPKKAATRPPVAKPLATPPPVPAAPVVPDAVVPPPIQPGVPTPPPVRKETPEIRILTDAEPDRPAASARKPYQEYRRQAKQKRDLYVVGGLISVVIVLGAAALYVVLFPPYKSQPAETKPPAEVAVEEPKPAKTPKAEPHETPAKATEQPPMVKWYDATKFWARQVEPAVKTRILSATIVELSAKDAADAAEKAAEKPKSKYLLIRLQTVNYGQTAKVEWPSWNASSAGAGSEPDRVALTDDTGKVYPQIDVKTLPVGDGGGSRLIGKNEWVEDLLAFEAPADGIKFLRLKPPASVFGKRGEFGFEIPKSMIRQGQTPEASSPPKENGQAAELPAKAAPPEPAGEKLDEGQQEFRALQKDIQKTEVKSDLDGAKEESPPPKEKESPKE
ncbi:MAG: DUF4339 domain-containing protein [Pirellulales bacterium]